MLGGHAHLTPLFDDTEMNFTHRIDRFSFGDPHGGIVQPLEGDEKVSAKSQMKYQYFVQVVPTDIESVRGTWKTYQYSVKELSRPIDHGAESHGTPGIYFRYDMSALKVTVSPDRETLFRWIIRLCAGVGGLVATSTIFCDLLSWVPCFVNLKAMQPPSEQPSQAK